MRNAWKILCTLLLLLALNACAAQKAPASGQTDSGGGHADNAASIAAPEAQHTQPAPPTRRLEVDYGAALHEQSAAGERTPADEAQKPAAGEAETQNEETAGGRLIVIDPGHQAQGNYETEPLGPGSTETKVKVSGGTASCNTGEPESRLALAVSLKLQEELETRGYTVLMTRTTEDVDLSNRDRAELANEAGADAFVRIHANASEDAEMSGAMTLCQTAASPFHPELYPRSHALAAAILDELTAEAGCRKLYVWETDTMSGINWSEVPVTIVETGFMTNPEEDLLLAAEEYQQKLACGIANGIDRYFRELESAA